MADTFLFANNARSTLASGITAVATTIFLQTGDGAKFPSPAASERFAVTMVDSSGNIEIAYCTSRTTDTLTVVRAQEGTSGIVFASGDVIELRMTDGALDNVPQKDGIVQVGLNADQWDGGNKTVSTSTPSGGSDGDVWFEREV